MPRAKDGVVHHDAVHVVVLVRSEDGLLDLSLLCSPFRRAVRDDADFAELIVDPDGLAGLGGPVGVRARGCARVGEDADEFRFRVQLSRGLLDLGAERLRNVLAEDGDAGDVGRVRVGLGGRHEEVGELVVERRRMDSVAPCKCRSTRVSRER